MSSQANRFAGLASDFAAQEARRLKVAAAAKAKKDAEKAKEESERQKEKEKDKLERKEESGGFATVTTSSATSSGRGRGRRGGRPYRGDRGQGRGRGERGRGGLTRGAALPTGAKPEAETKGPSDHHFPGSGDPVHPYDRRSGTGRGSEISKRGGGPRNWGRPEDALKHEDLIEKAVEQEAVHDKPITEVPRSEEQPEGKRERRRDKREYKREEKKVVDELDPYGTAVTYKEYQAIQAEKQKAGPTSKPEAEPSKPKAPDEVGKEASGTQSRERVGEDYHHEGGRGRRGGRRGGRWRGEGSYGPHEQRSYDEPKGDNWGADNESKDRSRPPRAAFKAQPEPVKEEPKKAEPVPFVMREEDFPELK